MYPYRGISEDFHHNFKRSLVCQSAPAVRESGFFMLSPVNSGLLYATEGTLRPFSCRTMYFFEEACRRTNEYCEIGNCKSQPPHDTQKLLQLRPGAWLVHHLSSIDSSWLKFYPFFVIKQTRHQVQMAHETHQGKRRLRWLSE